MLSIAVFCLCKMNGAQCNTLSVNALAVLYVGFIRDIDGLSCCLIVTYVAQLLMCRYFLI